MLTRTSAIDRETKSVINKRLEEYFKYEQGEDLDSVIKEVLNDKDVFLFFATCLKKNQGLSLGFMNYWDDTDVRVPYGLLLSGDPPKLRIYSYETLRRPLMDFHPNMEGKISKKDMFSLFYLADCLSNKRGFDGPSYEGYPSSEDFVRSVNIVLKEPGKYIVEFID